MNKNLQDALLAYQDQTVNLADMLRDTRPVPVELLTTLLLTISAVHTYMESDNAHPS